jgi:prepilin-type processing-associated H-X9-DG protein
VSDIDGILVRLTGPSGTVSEVFHELRDVQNCGYDETCDEPTEALHEGVLEPGPHTLEVSTVLSGAGYPAHHGNYCNGAFADFSVQLELADADPIPALSLPALALLVAVLAGAGARRSRASESA